SHLIPRAPSSTLLPYTTLFRSGAELGVVAELDTRRSITVLKDGDRKLVEIAEDRVKGTVYGTEPPKVVRWREVEAELLEGDAKLDRKSTRLNSSHVKISYAVFC